MPVAEYTPRDEPILHAVLWTGDVNDLEGMPDVNRLLGAVKNGTLHMLFDTARPNQDYIVRGVTGHFFVVTKEEFERTYVPLEQSPAMPQPDWAYSGSAVIETRGGGFMGIRMEGPFFQGRPPDGMHDVEMTFAIRRRPQEIGLQEIGL